MYEVLSLFAQNILTQLETTSILYLFDIRTMGKIFVTINFKLIFKHYESNAAQTIDFLFLHESEKDKD